MNGGLIDYQAAVVGFAVAFLLAVLLTPVVSQLAWMTGIVDRSVDERRMHIARRRCWAAWRSWVRS